MIMNEPEKRKLLIIFLLVSLLPPAILIRFPVEQTVQTLTLYISAIIGYEGIVLLLWMCILGTKTVTTLVFKDIAPVLEIHKWIGKYATPMILLHPILITISRGESWFYSILPNISSLTDRHILLGQISLALLFFTWFVSAYLREKIGFRPWKYLHYLAYICVPFALLHVPDLGSQEQASGFVKLYYLSLVVMFLIFSIMRVRSLLNLDRVRYVVQSQIALTDIDNQIILLPDTDSLKHPRSGQYVYIKLGYISEDHPFSVTHYDTHTGALTLTYRTDGMYTKELGKLVPGESVFMSGPFGTYTSELGTLDTTPVVYIAGGIGVTPFVSRILGESTIREQWLFLANRSREVAVLSRDLKIVLGTRQVNVYSSNIGDSTPNEEFGYIDADLLSRYLSSPHNYRFYLCGPPRMMTAVRAELRTMGIPDSQIYTEKFGW